MLWSSMLSIRAACSLSTDAQGVSIELGEREGVKWVGVRTFGPHELRLCLLKRESQKARRSQCCAACDRRQTPHKLDRRIASTGSPQSWVQSPESRVQSPESRQQTERRPDLPPTHLGEWLTDVDNSQRQRPRACAQASSPKARSPSELSQGSITASSVTCFKPAKGGRNRWLTSQWLMALPVRGTESSYARSWPPCAVHRLSESKLA